MKFVVVMDILAATLAVTYVGMFYKTSSAMPPEVMWNFVFLYILIVILWARGRE